MGLLRLAFVVVTVQGQSMAPTLKDKDRVLVWRFWPTRWIHYRQIVIVRQWKVPTQGFVFNPLIKRVIALPGDTITTFIDELPIEYRSSYRGLHDSKGQRIWHIPAGHIFIRGDNRKESIDSLTWGPIPSHHVCGIVLYKLS
jgi:signal peptidase I